MPALNLNIFPMSQDKTENPTMAYKALHDQLSPFHFSKLFPF